MTVIFVYALFVIVGDVAAIAVSAVVEKFSHSASLLVFFALFALVFWISWLLAVRVTERYLLPKS